LFPAKDAGVVQGMTDYYAKTDSKRIVEILMKVQQPHDRYIFDRLVEWFRGQNKVLALDLFGHIVRKHPTWLYKVAAHPFMKDVLKLLKTEKDIIPLMNALLCIVMLLPIIPKQMTAFLQDLFDIFSHLASWKCHNTIKLSEDQLLQLQLGLYKLFHRLYGMFPVNFIAHIKQEFVEKNTAVFTHTIRPLLESVKMHPSLLMQDKLEAERNTERWNKMQPHDIVTECAKFSIDYCETNQDSHIDCRLTPDRSGGGLQCVADVSSSFVVNSPLLGGSTVDFTPRSIENQLKTLHYSNLSSTPLYLLPSYIDKSATFYSPSDVIMATPPPTHTPTPTQIFTAANNYSLQTIAGATLPLGKLNSSNRRYKQSFMIFLFLPGGTSPPEAGIEATPETTPMKDIVNPVRPHPINPKTVRGMWKTNSQPSSPLKKDPNAFKYTEIEPAPSSKLVRMLSDREQTNTFMDNTSGISAIVSTSSLAANNPQSKDVAALLKQQPTLLQFSPNPSVDSTQEDQEVTEINRSNSNNGLSENDEDCEDDEDDDDDDDVTSDTTITGRRSRKIVGEPFNSEAHVGSPCSAGGLHIPDSRTINNFHKRFRLYSTGYDVDSSFSCGTSPSDVSYFDKAQSIRALNRTKGE
jgi:tuberous sclerosis 1